MVLEVIYFALILMVSILIGRKILSLIALKINSSHEGILISITVGIGALSFITFTLGILGLLYKWVFLTMFIIIFILSTREIKLIASDVLSLIGRLKLVLWRPLLSVELLIILLIILFMLINFIAVFAPPSEMDTISYHIAVPKLYAKQHSIYYIPDIILSNYPFFTEMLFLLALILKNSTTAIMFTFFFSILSAWGAYLFTKQFISKKSAMFATLIFYSLPIMSERSSQAMVEIPLAFYTLISIYSLFRWMESNNVSWLILSGILSGFIASIKLTGYIHTIIICIIIFYWILFKKKGSIGYTIKQLFYFAGISTLISFPWYLKTYIYTGNPVFPLMYNLFGGRYFNSYVSEQLSLFLGYYGYGKDIFNYLLLPWNITMHGTIFDAVTGITPIFLAFIPMLFFIRTNLNIKYLMFYSFAFITIWFLLSQQARFLLPVFLLLSIVSAYTVINLLERYPVKHFISALIIFMLSFNLLLSIGINIKKFPVVFGFESEEKYLDNLKDFNPYNVSMVINSLDKTTKTLLIGLHRGYYIDNDYIHGNPEYDAFIDYTKLKTPDELSQRLHEVGITHILVDRHFTSEYITKNIPYLNEYLDKSATLIYEHKDTKLYELNS